MFSYFVDEYEWFIDENIEWIKENNILLFIQGELLAEKYNEMFLDESFKQIDIKVKEHAEYLLNKLLQFEGIKVASLNINGENRYISLYKDEMSEHQKESIRKEILFCFCIAIMKSGTVIARSFSDEGVLNVFGIVGHENNKWLPIEKEKLYDILEYNRDTVNNKPVMSINMGMSTPSESLIRWRGEMLLRRLCFELKFVESFERKILILYSVINIQIKKNHPLYDYCVEMSKLSTNLFNAALFRQRQWLTLQSKDVLTENELQVIQEINKTISDLGLNKPGKIMSYNFIEKLMRVTSNPDFFAGLPMQTAQQVLKEVKNDLTSFFKSLAEFKKCPEKFTAKPELTGYKKKKSLSTFVLTNQDCVIYKSKKDKYYCKFPLTKQIANLGSKVEGKLKQVTVTPMHGIFQLAFVMENNVQTESKPVERIIALDPGVNNLLAVTNNCGLECILFNGKPLKAKNQYYNKKIAAEMSRQTKVTKTYFKPNKEYNRLTLKRNNQVRDYMFKTARYLINWCLENNIDTIIAGKNKNWKQESNVGDSNNQNFVLIPHAKLYMIIKNLCERYGINYFEQEESYTSKASFLDNDYIPTYGVDDENVNFSGKRVHRGLYRSSDGTKINADLNGSANILCKFCGEVFKVNFNQILKVNL